MYKLLLKYFLFVLFFILFYFILQTYYDNFSVKIISIIIFLFCFFKTKKLHTSLLNANLDLFPPITIKFNTIFMIFWTICLIYQESWYISDFDILLRIFIFINIFSIISNYLIKKKENLAFISKKICFDFETKLKEKNSKLTFSLGFIFVFLGLIYLEIFNHKYFFLQDDNFHQFLPVILQACGDFFSYGLFPEINPYQTGGLPTNSTGVYALTYPLTYISYAISKYVFNNEYLTIEILSSIHILIGYILAFIAGRMCKIKPIFASLYAICYSLSGFLVLIRSWYYMSSILAYAPLIIIITEHLKTVENKFKFKHILLYGLVVGMLVHAGNIQMWVYFVGFYILTNIILFLIKEINYRKLIDSLFITGISFSTALPIIYIIHSLFKNITREIHYGWDIINFWITSIIPSYILEHIVDFSEDFLKHRGQILYTGSVALIFIVIFLLALLTIFFAIKEKIDYRKLLSNNLYLILGISAFILCLGHEWSLWNILHSIGPLKYFSHPLKFIVFANLFLVLAGYIVSDRIITSKKSKIIISVLTLLFMSLHLVYIKQSFCTYKENTYFEIEKLIIKNMDINNYRILPLAPLRFENYKYSSLTLSMNFATPYKIHSIGAYDNNFENKLAQNIQITKTNYKIEPIIRKNHFNKIQEFLEEHGIKYIVLYENNRNMTNIYDLNNENIVNNILNNNLSTQYKKINQFDVISVFEIEKTRPLAFMKDSYTPIPIEFNSQGFKVSTSELKQGGTLIVNMVWFPNYKIFADGKELKYHKDEWNRIVIQLPPNTNQIIGRYHSEWNKGFILMIIGLLFIVCLYTLRNRYEK